MKIKFEPRDLWVGVYWNKWECMAGKYIDIYICILPMFPICIHLSWDLRGVDDD